MLKVEGRVKKIIFLVVTINLIFGGLLFSEGNESIDILKSPHLFATGGSYVSEKAPMTSIFNPASTALEQRISLNLNYLALFGDNDLGGYNGTGINLGVSLPLKIGVLTTSGYYLISEEITEFKTGEKGQGGLNLNFSKEVYEGCLFGIGLNGYFGTGWGVTADIGIIKHQGDIGFMKNMKWGVALGELGYSTFDNTESNSPSLFTPGGGLAFDLVDTENFIINIDSSLDFPFCQNARFTLGGDINIFNYGGLRFSSTADLLELLDNDVSALIPAFGIYVNFKTNFQDEKIEERGLSNNDVQASISSSPMLNGLWGISGGLNINLGVLDDKAPEIKLDFSKYEINQKSNNTSKNNKKDSNEKVSYKNKRKIKYVSNSKKEDKNDKEAVINSANNLNIDFGPNGEDIITYISPNNDGNKDVFEVPFEITDSRYIKGYSLTIEDAKGNVIKEIGNKEKRPENEGFLNFFERLFYVERGVDVPETIRWDGIGNNGETVPDGFYSFYIEAWDDNGNTSKTDRYGIIVDNTSPYVAIDDIKAENKIFSPNNDGNKDSFEIKQAGTKEDVWTAVIKGADGKTYRNITWKDSSPDNFIWDGKNNDGILVLDGVYFYYIETEDRAGNSFKKELSNIIINTESTPISLSVDSYCFSPGNNDAINKINFLLNVPVKTGIVDWSLTIIDDKNIPVKILSNGDLQETISFDGLLKKNYLSEGNYKGVLEIKYINGNNPKAESPVLVVDTSPPVASAKVSTKVFSPNGDGKKDEISMYQETSLEEAWYGYIEDSNGVIVKDFKWVNNAATSFVWDGYTNDGNLAPDGRYKYRLSATDRAGNIGESEIIEFSLDTEETPVMITSNQEAFSPNGDNVKERIYLKPILDINEGIKNYSIQIKDDSGKTIKSIKGQGRLKEEYFWDGFTDFGVKAVDGSYTAKLEVEYEKGDISMASTRSFILDTKFPIIEVETDFNLFSPDQDGKKDFIFIKQTSSPERIITAYLQDAMGNTVRDYYWENTVSNLKWDGTDNNGNTVKDGIFTYILSAEDNAGNLTTKQIENIEVDTKQTNVFVTASASGLTPNGDGKNDSIEFSTITTQKEGIESWFFKIIDVNGRVVKTFSDEYLPEKIIWDGTNEDNNLIEGMFTALYLVKYKKGNEPFSETKPFIVDVSPPEISVNINPKPFSPDNDGVEDELSIRLGVKDASDIRNWSFEIIDREGNNFMNFSGNGRPTEEIIWDGIGKNGELVLAAEDYAYKFTARDILENTNIDYGIIPVDVLVVKDGNNLKIRIANINFTADSAKLRQDDPEIKKKNEYVLSRLTEILKKYDDYKIVIEGHAVSVFWDDSVKAEQEENNELIPLSRARAETVKNYLTKLGINSNRMSTKGLGGQKPIVPHGDLINRWKNRRVEFLLIK